MSIEASPQRNSYSSLFHNRNFVALWIGQMISFIGDYFNWLALPILIQDLTGSTLMVGLSLISSSIPMLVLGPVAGVFVDRWDRKKTMMAADFLRAGLVLVCLTVQRADQVWIYYTVGFLMSCLSRFFYPARAAVLPLIVPEKKDLLAAMGLMQGVETMGFLIGPALAGFTIGFAGARVAFVFDSVSFLLSALAITFMTVPRTTPGGTSSLAAVWVELREGMGTLFSSRLLVSILVLMTVLQFGLGAINVLWVPYLRTHFGVGPEGLGIVDSAQGLGMLIATALLGFFSGRMKKASWGAWAMMAIGLLLVGIGVSPAFFWIIVLTFVIGLFLVPGQSVLMTLIQLAVTDLKRRRVNSALNAIASAAGLISMALASFFADAVGFRVIYGIFGTIIVIAGLLGWMMLGGVDLTQVEENQ